MIRSFRAKPFFYDHFVVVTRFLVVTVFPDSKRYIMLF